MIMDRAIEIMSSTENIRVLYNNAPVWIESIDRETRRAKVRMIGMNNQIEEVLISSLTDTGATVDDNLV